MHINMVFSFTPSSSIVLLTIVKKTQTAVVWTCLPFVRSGQSHLTRHGERGKKTRQTEEEVGLELAKSHRAVKNLSLIHI